MQNLMNNIETEILLNIGRNYTRLIRGLEHFGADRGAGMAGRILQDWGTCPAVNRALQEGSIAGAIELIVSCVKCYEELEDLCHAFEVDIRPFQYVPEGVQFCKYLCLDEGAALDALVEAINSPAYEKYGYEVTEISGGYWLLKSHTGQHENKGLQFRLNGE